MISDDHKQRMLFALSDHFVPNWDDIVGLETQQKTLYSLLQKCLLSKTNGMCLLVGPRGHGKRTLLKSCLHKLHHNHPSERFRSIKISGLMMTNGSSDACAVREMSTQLTVEYDVTNSYDSKANFSFLNPPLTSDTLEDLDKDYFEDSDGSVSWDEGLFDTKAVRTEKVRQTPDDIISPQAKVPLSAKKRRRTGSTSSTQLKRGNHLEGNVVDETPNNRFNTSFQSNLRIVTDAMKRAKVDGIPLLIILEDIEVFADRSSLRQVLLYHLLDKVGAPDTLIVVVAITSRLTISQMFEKRIRSRSGAQVMIHFPRYSYDVLKQILEEKLKCKVIPGAIVSKQDIDLSNHLVDMFSDNDFIHESFLRALSLGRSIRWFTGILTMVLSIAEDFAKEPLRKVFAECMVECGADLSNFSDNLKIDPILLNGDQRIQALYQLSGVQLAVLLTAKRLMTRDALDDSDKSETITLTFHRIHREYESFAKRQSFGVDIYGENILFRSFLLLLESEVMKLVEDHTGVGPVQHDYKTRSVNDWNLETMQHVPVYICVDLQTELHMALQERKLDCSTSLRDWALKSN